MKRIILPLTIIALLLLLFVGCNEDNAGLFKQVSDSEPKTKLGSIQILGIKDTTLYALTSVKGLHKYDTTTKTWSNIPSTQVIHATYDSVNNNLIYAQRATGDTKNKVFTFTGTTSTETDSLHVINMAPEHNLILVKNDDGDYQVKEYNDDASKFKNEGNEYSTFTDVPFLVAFDDNEYIVSGKADDKYDHYYYKDSSTKLSATGTNNDQFVKYQIVAMGVESTNLIVVTNDGSIWYGDSSTVSHKGNIKLANTSLTLYPSFVHDKVFYIQDIDRIFHTYNLSDGSSVSNDQIAKALNNEKAIKSFLVDNDDLYIGYIEIGLKVFDLGTQQFK